MQLAHNLGNERTELGTQDVLGAKDSDSELLGYALLSNIAALRDPRGPQPSEVCLSILYPLLLVEYEPTSFRQDQQDEPDFCRRRLWGIRLECQFLVRLAPMLLIIPFQTPSPIFLSAIFLSPSAYPTGT